MVLINFHALNLANYALSSRAFNLLCICSLSLLTACAETRLAVHGIKEVVRLSEPELTEEAQDIPPTQSEKLNVLGHYKVGRPYEINGLWYYPKVDPNYNQVGIASWYGEQFHGKLTANGAIYDMNALTAAHKTLPMPSKVRVTNLSNGRSLNVDINDRGPFVNGRIIDLSRRAAQLLGFEGEGLAMVRVQVMSPDGDLYIAKRFNTPEEEKALVGPNPTVRVAVNELPIPDGVLVKSSSKEIEMVTTAKNKQKLLDDNRGAVLQKEFFVQVGAFLMEENAGELSRKLSYFGEPVHLSEINLEGQSFYRVRVGPVSDVDSADALIQTLINAGYNDSHLVAGRN